MANKISRRDFLRLTGGAAAAASVIGLAGCGPAKTPEPAPTAAPAEPTERPEVTLQWWTSRPEDVPTYQDKILPVFKEAYPYINVEMTGYPLDSYFQALNAALSAGEGPDIFYTNYAVEIIPYAKAGLVTNLKGLIHAENLDPAAVSGVGQDVDGSDAIYGVPIVSHVWTGWYNKEILDKVGGQLPATYDDWLAMGEELKGMGYAGWVHNGQDGYQIAWYWAGTLPVWLGEAGLQPYLNYEKPFTDPEHVAILEELKRAVAIMQDGWAGTDYASSRTLFATGQGLTYWPGTWDIGPLKTANPDLDFRPLMVFPKTADQRQRVLRGGGEVYQVNAATQYKDEAVTLADWMTSVDFGTLIATHLQSPTTVIGAQVPEEAAQLRESLAIAAEYSYPEWMTPRPPIQAAYIEYFVRSAEYLSGKITSQEIAQAMQEALEKTKEQA